MKPPTSAPTKLPMPPSTTTTKAMMLNDSPDVGRDVEERRDERARHRHAAGADAEGARRGSRRTSMPMSMAPSGSSASARGWPCPTSVPRRKANSASAIDHRAAGAR